MVGINKKRISSFSIGLRMEQIDWIAAHPDFKIHKFMRDQLDKFIELKNKVEKI